MRKLAEKIPVIQLSFFLHWNTAVSRFLEDLKSTSLVEVESAGGLARTGTHNRSKRTPKKTSIVVELAGFGRWTGDDRLTHVRT